jgi:hypothetical protein
MGRYLEIIRQVEEAHKPTVRIIGPVEGEKTQQSEILAAGSSITWQGADGKQRGPAIVDFIHADADGTKWAFVTLPEGWATENLKYARRTDHAL